MALPAVAALLLAAMGGCAQFGVPQPPPALAAPAEVPGRVFVVYRPHTVLGFGHTGVIVAAGEGGGYLRYDQYASAEVRYGRRQQAGEAHALEWMTARLPSIFGFTREVIRRRGGDTVRGLVAPDELVVPLPGLDAAAVRAAAEARHARADGLERETARRYFWLFNNCQTFLADVLGAGGEIDVDYFPKHFVADAIERYEAADSGTGE